MPAEFLFINLFRAMAALWVVVAHCMIWSNLPYHWIPQPKLAVDIFMMISGFLMCAHSHKYSGHDHAALTASSNWKRFVLRRYFRLAPNYYASLLIVFLLSPYFLDGLSSLQQYAPDRWPSGSTYDPRNADLSLQSMLLHLSFTFGLFPEYSFSTFLPDWSLSLEMQFYCVFPLLMQYISRTHRHYITVAWGILSFFVGYQIFRFLHFPEPSFILMKLNYFIAGIFLCMALSNGQIKKSHALFLSGLPLTCLEKKYGFAVLLLPVTYLCMYWLGRSEIVLLKQNIQRRITDNPLVKFGADTSYGVYIFHSLLISGFGLMCKQWGFFTHASPGERFVAMLFFVLPSVYLIAYVAYRAIELPGIEMGQKLTNRWISHPGR